MFGRAPWAWNRGVLGCPLGGCRPPRFPPCATPPLCAVVAVCRSGGLSSLGPGVPGRRRRRRSRHPPPDVLSRCSVLVAVSAGTPITASSVAELRPLVTLRNGRAVIRAPAPASVPVFSLRRRLHVPGRSTVPSRARDLGGSARGRHPCRPWGSAPDPVLLPGSLRSPMLPPALTTDRPAAGH